MSPDRESMRGSCLFGAGGPQPLTSSTWVRTAPLRSPTSRTPRPEGTMSLVGHAYDKQSPATLVVADWVVDPETVVTTCAARDRSSALHLVVPAWLHGLDWAGDPFASVPCARRQLERVIDLCRMADLRITSAEVGDPDPLSAISDALGAVRVDEIVLFARGRHVAGGYPFSLARRAERLTGLRVTRVAARPAPRGAG